MQRIAPAQGRIVELSALLQPAAAAVVADAPAPAERPDPAAELERERKAVLERAEAEGLERGLKRAEARILASQQQAESRVEQAHAAQTRKLQAANDQLAALLRAWPAAADELEQRLEAASLEIAYACVTRLLGEIGADGELMKRLCRQALSEYRQRPVLVRVAAADLDAVSELAADSELRVLADARLSPGQCRLETHKGLYDTSLEVRLDALKQALLHSLDGGDAGA